MKEYFTFIGSMPVYLYGAASIGKIVYERNPSLNVCGFLDMRASEIKTFMGLPVYTVQQASEQISRNVVIVISVKNVFEQEEIASKLYEAGFTKLIYKSRTVLEGHGDQDELKLSEAWEQMLNGSFRINEMEYPCFKNEINYVFSDMSVLSDENGQILAYIPIELIYTNDRNDKWSDINIQGYYPHIYFFYYLANHRNGQVEDYLQFAEGTALAQGDIKITDAWRENVLRNRVMVYENMRLSLDVNFDFFHRNAASAKWNEKGYFNLTSGKHRCAFLVAQGYRYIALQMGKDDYLSFLSYGNIEDIRDRIIKEKIRQLCSKVYHPWFYRYACSEPMYYTNFQIEALCRAIKLAHECKRKIKLYTNIPEYNSLYRILDQCRLITVLNEFIVEGIDVILYDETVPMLEKTYWKNDFIKQLWHISYSFGGNIIAEYYSLNRKIYFWEEI